MSVLLRVGIAGSAAAQPEAFVHALRATLPEGVACEAWTAQGPAVELLLFLGLDALTSRPEALQDELALRQSLTEVGQSFQVLHGARAAQLRRAQHAIGLRLLPLMPDAGKALMREEIHPRWQGVCDGCSDPQCEGMLFRRLIDGAR